MYDTIPSVVSSTGQHGAALWTAGPSVWREVLFPMAPRAL